jgi:RNA polymerase sigma-70 factor (ECF subfamily)
MKGAADDSPLVTDRGRYLALAYRMLGSRADAEDVVQEAFLRTASGSVGVEHPQRYLLRVVANLCVDRLRAERVRRQAYPGPWLPEPVLSDDEPDGVSELAESLSMGFLLLLERLSPGERIVFVLREAFELDFTEIASILGISAEACRQRLSRARRHLKGQAPQQRDPEASRALLARLMSAVTEQRVDAVIELLADDAILISDGGGVASAAIRPVSGRERIARVMVHIAAREQEQGPLDLRFSNINGDWGLLIMRGETIHSAVTLELRDGRIRRIYVLRNPEKLSTPDVLPPGFC